MAGATVSAAPATEPATPQRPDRPAGLAPGAARPMVPNGRNRGMGGGRMASTAEERAAFVEFAQENMPNLFRMWEDAPRGTPRRFRVFGFGLQRYRLYQQLKENGTQEQLDQMLKRIQSEDELFALVQELQDAPADKQSEIRQRLRARMRDVMSAMLQDRQERIERLKQMLQHEERALQNDRGRIEQTTEERVQRLINETRGDRPDGASTEPSSGDSSDNSRDATTTTQPR
jgi:hypothetical protein